MENPNLPLISVVIPNYNKAGFVGETIDSVILQTYTNWEAIIVDDASTDNSIQKISNYCKQDSRIQLVKQTTNQGGSRSRNIGLNKAKGRYVVFLDSDDLLEANCFKNRLYQMTQNSAYDFAVFPMGTFYQKIGDSSSIWNNFKGICLNRFLKHDLPWAIPSVIWDIKYLKHLGGFNETFSRLQDVELHTRALLDNEVRYGLFSNTSCDCFYRISEDRIAINIEEVIKNQVNGSKTYISFFMNKLEREDKGNLVPMLKGTLLKSIFFCYSQMENHQLDKYFIDSVIDDLMKTFSGKLMTKTDEKIVHCYKFIKQLAPVLRGVDRVTLKLTLR